MDQNSDHLDNLIQRSALWGETFNIVTQKELITEYKDRLNLNINASMPSRSYHIPCYHRVWSAWREIQDYGYKANVDGMDAQTFLCTTPHEPIILN